MPILFHRHFSLGTVLYFAIVIAVVGGVVAYGIFQARHLIEGPVITLTEEPAYAQPDAAIEIKGNAQNIISISINDRQIFTDDSGNFTETLVLPKGYTIMTLTAEDRYGRVRTVERTYVRS
ncbi:hypothetical protein K2X96_02095 [Patescibacteria group bacterium]|nr:hypothetical protein [Patescibacteria group bacterium]